MLNLRGFVHALPILFLVIGLACEAQPVSPKPLKRRISPKTAIDSFANKGALTNFDFDLNEVVTTTESDSLDRTLSNSYLYKLYEESLPSDIEKEFDYDKNRQLANRMLAIKGGQSISHIMKKSELAPLYQDIKRGFKQVQDHLRFSLQDDGEDWVLSTRKKGEKLFEFGLELDASTGFEPQMRVGERFRIRYNYLEQVSSLEYGVSF